MTTPPPGLKATEPRCHVVVQAIHDFIAGPLASAAVPGSLEALRRRHLAAWLARANAVVGIIVVGAAVRLARGG